MRLSSLVVTVLLLFSPVLFAQHSSGWIKFQQLFEQFFELFTQQLFKWIQFVERSLLGRFVFLKQSQFRRIGFAQLQFRISGVTFERAPFPLWRGRRDP